jgi:hypothetical protein
MSIPLYKFPPCVDWDDVVRAVENKHNIVIRDYAGLFSKKNCDQNDKIFEEWLDNNGYDHKDPCLNIKSDGTDWEHDSPEMKRRIEISSKYSKFFAENVKKPPYLDYWHLLCDGINRGGVTYLYFNDLYFDDAEKLPEQYKNWVQEINAMIIEEVKDSAAYNSEENCLTFTVDW